MQESPNFQNFYNHFSQFSLPNLIDDPRQQVPAPHRAVIERAYKTLQQYFTENEFREKLTLARRNNIEGQINNILAQFDQMVALLNQSPPTLLQNIEPISNNIQSYLEDIDLRFTTPFGLYIAEQRSDLPGYVNSLKETAETARQVKDQVDKTLSDAELLIGQGTSTKLGDYYQILANGMTISENDEARKAKKFEVPQKAIWVLMALGACIVIGAQEILTVVKLVNISEPGTKIRLAGAILIAFALIANRVSRAFTRFRPGGYDRAAALWLGATIVAVIATGIYASVLLQEMGPHADWQQLIPKIVTLLAPAYFVRFCVQNYRSNKHLFISNTHRATVSRDAKGFSEQVSTATDSLKKDELTARAQIIDRASIVVFDPGETGYITTKEGAGSESMFDGTPFDSKLNK
jgi:hypothetical protein